MISYQDVSVKFNDNYIIKDLNLTINQNDKVVISGRSGIGKTTLLYLLMGFVVPDRGRIIFNGENITSKNIWSIRKKTAYISQDVNIGNGKVIDLIKSYFNFKANAEVEFNHNEISNLLKKFLLTDELLEKDVEELSGGERQRAAIIIAALLKRSIFLLDEVTSGLDSKLKKRVIEYFLAKKDSTLIAISHDELWHNNDRVKIFDLEKKKWVR